MWLDTWNHYENPFGGGKMQKKGIAGIKGFMDEIQDTRIRYSGKLKFPDLSSVGKWAARTLTVGNFGEMFSSIQGAINSVRDAAEDNQYLLLISGGDYNESLQLSSWIHLWGTGDVRLITASDEIAITVTGGGDTWMFGVRVLPTTGVAPAVFCTNANLNLFRCYLNRGISISGNSECAIDFVESGPLVFGGGGLLTVRSSNSSFTGGLSLNGVGAAVVLRLISTLIIGQVITNDLLAQLQFHQVWVLDPLSRPLLSLAANVLSYLRMQNSLLSTDVAQPTIERNAAAGTVQVWTMQNALSSAYGPNVNENITTPLNVTDAEIASFRL